MGFNLKNYLENKYNNTFSYDEEMDFFADENQETVQIKKKKARIIYSSKEAAELRLRAQAGDVQAFVYLMERYAETIERALYYYRDLLNPNIDLNEYKIEMSKTLKRLILKSDSELKEGEFVKKLIGLYRYSVFNVNNRFNQHKFDEDKKVEDAKVSLDERIGYNDYLGEDSEDNENMEMYEVIPSVDQGEELAIDNARELFSKIVPLIPQEYFKFIYDHVINKRTFKEMAKELGCSDSNLSEKFVGLRTFLQKIKKYSGIVHMQIGEGYSLKEIAKTNGLTVKQVEYYNQMYDYLYENGEMPTKKPVGIWNPELYIRYSIFAGEVKENEGK